MPKKQTTAGKRARAVARAGEKYTTALRGQTKPGAGTSVEHRGFLDYAPGFRPFRDTDLFERIGGCFRTRGVPWGSCLIGLSSAVGRNLLSGLC